MMCVNIKFLSCKTSEISTKENLKWENWQLPIWPPSPIYGHRHHWACSISLLHRSILQISCLWHAPKKIKMPHLCLDLMGKEACMPRPECAAVEIDWQLLIPITTDAVGVVYNSVARHVSMFCHFELRMQTFASFANLWHWK